MFKRFTQSILVILYSLTNFSAWSAEPISLPSPPPAETEGLLQYQPSAKEKSETYQFLNKQDDPNSNRDDNVKNYESGKSRAQQMVQMLQNKELTKAFQKITAGGMKTLDENPEIKNPLGVIVGAASLWYGRTVKLIRGDDFSFSAKMEARSRRSEFSMGSPLLNGRLKFDANEGTGIGVNRNIAVLDTEAALQYNTKDQVFSTEVRHRLAPNIDLSFGASRLDQNTKIEYRLNF